MGSVLAALTASRRGALLLVAGLSLGLLLLFALHGYESTWRLWQIPVLVPIFSDLRVITHGADSHAMGFDPLVVSPADPLQRLCNYPRIWHSLFALGLNSSHTEPLGLALVLAFLVGVVLSLPNASRPILALSAASLSSPAVLWCIERGNIDLVIFFLLALAIVLVRHWRPAAHGLLLLATVLKLYPLFALTLLLREPPRRLSRQALLLAALIAAYLALIWRDLPLVSAATPRATELSYGMNVAWMRLAEVELPTSLSALFRVLAWLGVLAVAGLGLWGWRQRLATPSAAAEGSFSLDAFRVGASIYAGSFLLGNNWDYRLSFLLFTLPQLALWVQAPAPRLRWTARATLVVLLLSQWAMLFTVPWQPLAFAHLQQLPVAPLYAWFVDELANWLLFGLLVLLLGGSLPAWLRSRQTACAG